MASVHYFYNPHPLLSVIIPSSWGPARNLCILSWKELFPLSCY